MARSKPKRHSLAATARFLLALFLVALVIRSFVFAPFSIPSPSMLPGLMIGDALFAAKWRFTPRRGDVVVFRGPDGEDYIKRVVGLPGDTVALKAGVVTLNGKAIPQTRIADYLMPVSANSPCRTADPDAARPLEIGGARFCSFDRSRETLPGGRSYEILDQGWGPGDDFDPVKIPAGHLFVLGDNRDDSRDSRFPAEVGGIGLLPADRLIGRAGILFYSSGGSASSWIGHPRWQRIGRPVQ